MNTVQAFELARRKYGVAISWDTSVKNVDLDLQVVLIDTSGRIVDAIYHNNLKSMNGAVVHSGDKQDGTGDQFAELIWVDFTKIKLSIKLMIFVVAAASGGHLVDVRKGLISVIDSSSAVLAQYTMEASRGDVDAVVMMKRSNVGRWSVEAIDALAEEGSNFLDILDVISALIKQEIPEAPEKQQANFVTDKGGSVVGYKPQAGDKRRTVNLPPSNYSAIFSWEIESMEVESDVQVLLVNAEGIISDIVSERNARGTLGAVVRKDLSQGEENCELTYSVDLGAMQDVKLAVFVLYVRQGFSLHSIRDLSLIFLDEREDKSKARLNLETAHPQSQSKVLLMMRQSDAGAWTLMQMDEEPQPTSTVYASAEHLSKIIREVIPTSPEPAKLMKLVMSKGSAVWLPPTPQYKKATLSMSCSFNTSSQRPGVAMSLVMLDKRGAIIETSHIQKASSAHGQIFSLDINGAEPNCDYAQTFTVALARASKMVSQVFILLLLREDTIDKIRHADCRLGDEAGVELASYSFAQVTSEHPGVVLGRLYREQDRTWSFQALGNACRGRSWTDPDCIETVRRIADLEPAALGAYMSLQGNTDIGDAALDVGEESMPVSSKIVPPPPPDGATHRRAFEASRAATGTGTFELLGTMEVTGEFEGGREAFMPPAVKPHLLISAPTDGAARGRRNRKNRYGSGPLFPSR
mmetsp:Transcript_38611/g.110998  ORF Transcript_38611/g.110998 Transcript_38611/m.110998 type:complete len:693 (-) Transcript_38611:103-2181(-)